ncbi:hypothetical protein [uncultured Pseudodesulfovibrio sp.]|uniref:hypothetical protein n=1 Tax=uncultured Pseudodesulfovibrio sp. TaxID=2035858 RepID=UPI0029C62108|nr:hypothetical protein [uncultured Pseudodesulfovibrio sp.]
MTDRTGGGTEVGFKSGGDTHQEMGAGNFMGDMTDNSAGGWGADGEQFAAGEQGAVGGDVTDNVDIGAINISS